MILQALKILAFLRCSTNFVQVVCTESLSFVGGNFFVSTCIFNWPNRVIFCYSNLTPGHSLAFLSVSAPSQKSFNVFLRNFLV